MKFGKSVWGRDSCGAFCFLMYSIRKFTALISEEQNWRKLIYEKPDAYVGGGRTPDCGDLWANFILWAWDPS